MAGSVAGSHVNLRVLRGRAAMPRDLCSLFCAPNVPLPFPGEDKVVALTPVGMDRGHFFQKVLFNIVAPRLPGNRALEMRLV